MPNPSVYFDLLPALVFALAWLGVVAFLRVVKRQPLVYLGFFTIFYIT